MKPFKVLFVFLFLLFLLMPIISNVEAGYGYDPQGDCENVNCDIIKLEVSEDILAISLVQTPKLNESDALIFFYNIWVDTSGEDYSPDTETWDPDHELYEYLAHFKWYYTNGEWLNESYLIAFNYYIDDEGEKQEGVYYWNEELNKWQTENPEQYIAKANNATISFDVTGAIYREEPLGTGVVIQAVANAGSGLTIDDIAPNNGWIDEFDNLCEPPSKNTTNTPIDFTVVLGALVFSFVLVRRVKKKY
ncbi:MAG: hypothetical protein ACTSXD_03395 [Candidatus Heimdallarchaeaceae archaeon]